MALSKIDLPGSIISNGSGMHGSVQVCASGPIEVVEPPLDQWGARMKRTMDVVLAFMMILLTLPVLVSVAIAVSLESPGPFIFKQRRHGLNGSEFQVFKFRTMRATTREGSDGAQQTRREDVRITRIGRFLRNTSLDELPQLFNVLNGTMSMVGPRPHPTVMRTEGMLCEEIVPEYGLRHRVKPGITGWAQVNGYRGATETVHQLAERVRLDIEYVDTWSVLFDLKILLLTPYCVVCQRQNAF